MEKSPKVSPYLDGAWMQPSSASSASLLFSRPRPVSHYVLRHHQLGIGSMNDVTYSADDSDDIHGLMTTAKIFLYSDAEA